MQRIQKLYANDKQRMQMEIMKLYQTHKTSPMSGCLPMLIQIPIFFALYKALLISVQMRNAHFLWISDLAVMDPYFILPILMGASMWLQQRLQSGATKSADKNDVAAQTQRAMRWIRLCLRGCRRDWCCIGRYQTCLVLCRCISLNIKWKNKNARLGIFILEQCVYKVCMVFG